MSSDQFQPTRKTTFKCPLCGSTAYDHVYSRRVDGSIRQTPIYKCGGCSVLFEDPTGSRNRSRLNGSHGTDHRRDRRSSRRSESWFTQTDRRIAAPTFSRTPILLAMRPWFLLLLALWSHDGRTDTLQGRVVAVADGDTITVLDAQRQQHKIRLAGIDTASRKGPPGTTNDWHQEDVPCCVGG
jgi:hypothetical protein